MPPTHSKLPALMLTMTLLSSIFATGCGGTRTIQQHSGQISIAAEDKALKVYVKDEKGVKIKADGMIHTGDYIVPDAGVPPAPAAPKSQTPVSAAPAAPPVPAHPGEVLLMKT